jgi:hypothetical protein
MQVFHGIPRDLRESGGSNAEKQTRRTILDFRTLNLESVAETPFKFLSVVFVTN